VRFGSREWVDAAVAAINAERDLPSAIAGLGPDLAVVVERDAGWPAPLAVWGRAAGGRIAEVRVLHDEDELLELEPAYVIRAPYRTWKAVFRRALDPVKAAVGGKLRVQGDLEALLRRTQYRHVVEGALGRVPTEFPDE
jgi:hypothetical protein